jgi:arsenite methyltransferase
MEVLPTSESAAERQTPDRRTNRQRQLNETAFDQLSWVYTLCRERLFQDDTEEIIQILVSFGLGLNGACLVELGCGPGFYSTRVAKRFRLLNVTGVDRSIRLVEHGRARARLLHLTNCDFLHCDVRALTLKSASVEAVITSRLFMMLDERETAMNEVYRVLRPGGLFFIAEPVSQRRAVVPVLIMRSLACLMRVAGRVKPGEYGENIQVKVLDPEGFGHLLGLHPWRRIVRWQTRHYQYAVCAKGIETGWDFVI